MNPKNMKCLSHTSGGHRFENEAAELNPVVEANGQDSVQINRHTLGQANSNGVDSVISRD